MYHTSGFGIRSENMGSISPPIFLSEYEKEQKSTDGLLKRYIDDMGINVTKDPFNAKGDGITDDTTAIQAAIDYCYTKGGGTVILPQPGKYVFSNLAVKDYVTLKMNWLERIYTPTNLTLALDGFAMPYCLIRKINSTGIGITVEKYGSLNNINIHGNGVTGSCIECAGTIDGLYITRATDALKILSGTSFSSNIFLYGNLGDALTIDEEVSDLRFQKCNIASNVGYGILLLGGNGAINFSNGKVEWNYKDNVCIRGYVHELSFDDFIIDASNWFDFHVETTGNCLRTRFNNCLIIGSRRDLTSWGSLEFPITPVGETVMSQFYIENNAAELIFTGCDFRKLNSLSDEVTEQVAYNFGGNEGVIATKISLCGGYTDVVYANIVNTITVEHYSVIGTKSDTSGMNNKDIASGIILQLSPITSATKDIYANAPSYTQYFDWETHKTLTKHSTSFYDSTGTLVY
jgi:hypothetical protein